ncbi:hypothetical protein [Kamptonema formosum]|uniref:hypothetical protein n=1 Tax=Kamptonema formosum TaxID=331992 RepID=UPI000346CAE9|nr:hypothetical protein [Oscillatoria sp. PCC 10802]
MSTVAQPDSKAKILEAFNQLIAEKKKIGSKVATKEEEAAKEQNKQLLEVVSTYTTDSIVKGLADLQLEFSSIIIGLSEKLTKESSKLDELKRAIEIETQLQQEVRETRLVADALYVLTQEHQEKLKALEQDAASYLEALDKDKADKRKAWQKEQEEYESSLQEESETAAKDRQKEAEDYQYKIERTRKLEMDEYENRARQQERELQDIEQANQKQWADREKFLADNQAQFEEYQQKVATMPEELKKAEDEARKRAIEDVSREAKVKSDLLAKEWEKTKEGYDFKVQSLEQAIQRQNEQIGDLSKQLQDTIKQAQELAMRAFASTSNGASVKS